MGRRQRAATTSSSPSERELDGDEFRAELASHVSGRIGVNRDVLVFVHGFNTSFEEARDRAAQITADSRFGGVAVLFTWPTKHELFGYVSDKDSATASRDALQDLLQDVSATPGVGKIHVLAHSMGGWLAMEALRQASIAGNRDLSGHLGEVMLASPDIDMDVFAAQMAHLRPANVTVFATANDRALSLSSAIAQSRQRVGAINPSKPEDRQALEKLGAKVYDLIELLRRLHRPRAPTPTRPTCCTRSARKWRRRARRTPTRCRSSTPAATPIRRLRPLRPGGRADPASRRPCGVATPARDAAAPTATLRRQRRSTASAPAAPTPRTDRSAPGRRDLARAPPRRIVQPNKGASPCRANSINCAP